ncbi:hypothetical protein ABIB82_002162 [Bradyrhizobium sp. i1.8.4]
MSIMPGKRTGAAASILAFAAFLAASPLLHRAKAEGAVTSEFRRGLGISHIMARTPVESGPPSKALGFE